MRTLVSFLSSILLLSNSALAQEKPTPENEPNSYESPNTRLDIPDSQIVYSRPFVLRGQNASIGGYLESNYGLSISDGIRDGPGFALPRFNVFIFSPIGPRIRLVSELEFENGTEEINIETASLDVEIAPELALRMGVILPPIGAFNQAHDAPLYNFIQRPLVSTTVIPSTLSELGAGAHGSFFLGPFDLDYQVYLVQGLSDGVLDNSLGRTSIPDGKDGALFAADNNGEPGGTGRVAIRYGSSAEVGISAYAAAYSSSVVEGERVDGRRTLTLAAIDWAFVSRYIEIRGEAAYASVDIPRSLETLFGNRQFGVYVDAVAPLVEFRAMGFDKVELETGLRFDYVDWNSGTLSSAGTGVGDEVTQLTGTLAMRPGSETVFMLNYVYAWQIDFVGNAPVRTSELRIGAATYF